MNNKEALEMLSQANMARRMWQMMEIAGMEYVFPKAIWLSISPNRKERRMSYRRRVRNNSFLTNQTPHRDYEKVLRLGHNIAFDEKIKERRDLLDNV